MSINFKYQRLINHDFEFSKFKVGDLVQRFDPLETFGYGDGKTKYHRCVGMVVEVCYSEICGYNRQDKPKVVAEYVVRWADPNITPKWPTLCMEHQLIKV